MLEQNEFGRNHFPPETPDLGRAVLEEFDLPTHYAFIDESGLNEGRHRAIAMISLEVLSAYPSVREACVQVQKRWPSEKEMKWAEVRSEGKSAVASQMVSMVSKLAERSFLRVDVLHWDTQDRFHSVIGRDDRENANVMARRLLKRVTGRRWPYSKDWVIYPDEGSLIDWTSCAQQVAAKTIEVREAKSDDLVLVQVADLFAGVSTFAGNKLGCLLREKARGTGFSTGDRAKVPVLEGLIDIMTVHGVCWSSGRGLVTPGKFAHAPVNFWPFSTPKGLGRAAKRGEGRLLDCNRSLCHPERRA